MPKTPWDRIREAMHDKGLKGTQKECAALLGVAQPSISEWASGDSSPSMANSITLGKKLNVCVEWILTERGPKRPGPPMEPAAQSLWDLWGRIPREDHQRVVGFAEALARPSQPIPAIPRQRSVARK
jgi:transcriptional regulator with XRE-family HTH domain